MTRPPFLVLALAALAAPALACGNGECEPPPPPSPPPVFEPVAPAPRPEGRDPSAAAPIIHYGICCAVDGKMFVSTAWLRDPVTAYEQCRAREDRLQSLPECPGRLRGQDGGE